MSDRLSAILQKRLLSRIEKQRRVRSLDGVKRFGLPIGSPIPVGGKPELPKMPRVPRPVVQPGEGRGVKQVVPRKRSKVTVSVDPKIKVKPPKSVRSSADKKTEAVDRLVDKYGSGMRSVIANNDPQAVRLASVTRQISKKYGIKNPSIKRILSDPGRKNQKSVSDEDRIMFREALADFLSNTPYASGISGGSDRTPTVYPHASGWSRAIARSTGRKLGMQSSDIDDAHQEGLARSLETVMRDSVNFDRRHVDFLTAFDYKPEKSSAWADREHSLRDPAGGKTGLADIDVATNVFASIVAARTRSSAQTINNKSFSGGRAKRSKAERQRDRRDIYESIDSMSEMSRNEYERRNAFYDSIDEADALYAMTALIDTAPKSQWSGKMNGKKRAFSFAFSGLLEKQGLIGSSVEVEVVKHDTKGLPVFDDEGNTVITRQKVFISHSDFFGMKPSELVSLFSGDDRVNGLYTPQELSDLTGLSPANIRQSKKRGREKFLQKITDRAQLSHIVDMDQVGEERDAAKEALRALQDETAFGRYEAMLQRRDRRVTEAITELVKEQDVADTILRIANERMPLEPENASAIKEISDSAFIRRMTAERDERIIRRDKAIDQLRSIAPEVLSGDITGLNRRRSEAKRRASIALERYNDLDAEIKLRQQRNMEFAEKPEEGRSRLKNWRRTLPSGRVVDIEPDTSPTRMRQLRDERDRALSSSTARPDRRDQAILGLISAISEHEAHIAEINERHGDIIGVRSSLDDLPENAVFRDAVDERTLSRTLLDRIRSIPVRHEITEVRTPEIKEDLRPSAKGLLVSETLAIKAKISNEQKRVVDSPELQELGDLMTAIAGHDGLLRELELSGVSRSDQEYVSVKSVMDEKVRAAAELSRQLGVTGRGTRKAPTIQQYAEGVDRHLAAKSAKRATEAAERAAREASRPVSTDSARSPVRMTLKELDAEIKSLAGAKSGGAFARLNALTIEARRRRFAASQRKIKKSINRLKVIRLLAP